jgi:hypothetical protein
LSAPLWREAALSKQDLKAANRSFLDIGG